ncbi:MAG: hypothetical protein IT464_07580 [Planctomycetes bacterium]|nr:hypothetical protein [Planctomycetota bacterium]
MIVPANILAAALMIVLPYLRPCECGVTWMFCTGEETAAKPAPDHCHDMPDDTGTCPYRECRRAQFAYRNIRGVSTARRSILAGLAQS